MGIAAGILIVFAGIPHNIYGEKNQIPELKAAAEIYSVLLQDKGALASGDTRVVAGLISSGVFLAGQVLE